MTALPDLLSFADGRPVATPDDWPCRRAELRDAIIDLEYGGLPPTPDRTTAQVLHEHHLKALDGAAHGSVRITAHFGDERVAFMMDLIIPVGDGEKPAVITGDRCWRTANDQVVAEVLGRGYALAQFNRTELAADHQATRELGGLYELFPGGTFGALAAWAWGYHRCVDVLADLAGIDASRLAIVGHSRGGKTTLLAGATDERIALTGVNNSGAGGAGCFRMQCENSETLADLMRNFPFWFGPALGEYIGREEELPFDQHFLKAMVAPRALVTLEAMGDLWANPSGTQHTHDAAKAVWQLAGDEQDLGIVHREGGHGHGPADWRAFLDFADWRFGGQSPARPFDHNPFA